MSFHGAADEEVGGEHLWREHPSDERSESDGFSIDTDANPPPTRQSLPGKRAFPRRPYATYRVIRMSFGCGYGRRREMRTKSGASEGSEIYM